MLRKVYENHKSVKNANDPQYIRNSCDRNSIILGKRATFAANACSRLAPSLINEEDGQSMLRQEEDGQSMLRRLSDDQTIT